jgi:drug/metabolite transporter (DMT)-like permease
MGEGDEIATSSRHSPSAAPSSARGLLYIAAATFCWGLSATLGRAAFTGQLLSGSGIRGVDPLILSQCRTTFSCIAVAVGLLMKRGSKRLRIPASGLIQLLLLGLGGVAVSNYFYYLAIQRTNVATAIILQYTAPVWVLLYMVLRGRERLTAAKTGSVLLAVTGIALVIGLIGSRRIHLDTIGVVAALLASFSFTYYNIGGHHVLATYDRWIVLLYTTLAASVFWVIVNPPTRIIAAHYSATTWVFLAVFSFLSVLIPFSFYFAGLENLVPTRAIIASCLEPVFSILIAAVVLREFVGAGQGLGIAMVLTAIVLAQRPASDTKAIAGPVD